MLLFAGQENLLSIFRSTSKRSDNPYQASPRSQALGFDEPDGGMWLEDLRLGRASSPLGRDRADVLERRQRSSEHWEEYVHRFEMTALAGQDGIEMAGQSGRSPSPYSTDEAFGASNTIRQRDNPVAARLKCVVDGTGYPCRPSKVPHRLSSNLGLRQRDHNRQGGP